MNEKKSIILKDILWYFIGNLAPLVVGFIKSPIFTRKFTTEEFGAYSLVFFFFTYLSSICYSWIVSCVFRYYFRYKKENKIDTLFSNLTFLYILFSVVILIVSLSWYAWSDTPLIKQLILLCFLNFFTSEIISLFYVRPRLEGKTFYYNSLQTIRAIGAFGILLYLTFIKDLGIEAFLTSNIVMNLILIGIVVIPDVFKLHLSPRLIEKEELKTFYKYGRIGLVINVCSVLLVSSDRFLIQFFTGLSEVGIYSQNYNIAQISICMLIQVYWAAINPYLLPLLEFKPPNMKEQIYEYLKIYFFCFFPITVYFSVYAREIAEVMLGESFRVGYSIIMWAAIAEFIIGLAFLSISDLKFKDKFKLISAIYIFGVLINILLNAVFIPLFGYQMAAIETVISNLILLIAFVRKDNNSELFTLFFKNKNLRNCLVLLGIQVLIHLVLIRYSFPLYFYIAEGVIFCLAYFLIAIKNKWINFDKISNT